jgi:aryl-alcohol dehydrogenase-like predicted oxidoreductase
LNRAVTEAAAARADILAESPLLCENTYIFAGEGSMKYRTLGRTGLLVSEIGFGCGSIGGLMVRGSPEEQVAAVDHAVKSGINYFDTAPQYGNGKSEVNLGQVLSQLKPDVRVATKVGFSREDLKDLPGTVRSSVETSLKRLDRERLDLLQLHTPVSADAGGDPSRWTLGLKNVLSKGGVADVFEQMRSERLISHLGFTGLGETDSLHGIVSSKRFDVVQAYYNLLNPTAGIQVPGFVGQDFRQLIDAAAKMQMGVVVIRVMAGGALGGEVARRGHASPTVGGALVPNAEYDVDENRAAQLAFLRAGDVRTLAQAAVRFALMHESVSTVLVGFSSIEQIDDAATCSGKKPLSAAIMKRLNSLWSSDFAAPS